MIDEMNALLRRPAPIAPFAAVIRIAAIAAIGLLAACAELRTPQVQVVRAPPRPAAA